MIGQGKSGCILGGYAKKGQSEYAARLPDSPETRCGRNRNKQADNYHDNRKLRQRQLNTRGPQSHCVIRQNRQSPDQERKAKTTCHFPGFLKQQKPSGKTQREPDQYQAESVVNLFLKCLAGEKKEMWDPQKQTVHPVPAILQTHQHYPRQKQKAQAREARCCTDQHGFV